MYLACLSLTTNSSSDIFSFRFRMISFFYLFSCRTIYSFLFFFSSSIKSVVTGLLMLLILSMFCVSVLYAISLKLLLYFYAFFSSSLFLIF